MTTGPDDKQLLDRTARDLASFEPLMERHSTALHGYFARRTPGAAADLLAGLWLQAYATRHGFDPARGSVRAWLFGVARNALFAHWRLVAAARPGTPRASGDDAPWEAVDDRLVTAAVAPRLRELLAQLPADERELLLPVAWEQLTPSEAADVAGIPAATARTRLHHTRNRMRSGTPFDLTGDLA
ncbi:RNA polymerase sigma factor [Streptomyces sporangiiformans]|uniref:RNA polymerase sigma factor n=1 Tax=Streptomyces sporangiiformans TaxID=2315329 RepID=A0A505DM65_9ACTN|nr:RNA polymerase sigma factor [Streptomyces sporangiiformans]TPQ21189.1 RNA polymerase sigma factor [Streptomyces sporangiiformans]